MYHQIKPSILVILASLFFLAACSKSSDKLSEPWPVLGSQCDWMFIDTGQLKPAFIVDSSVELDPSQSFRRPFDFFTGTGSGSVEELTLKPGIERYHYRYLTVGGHYFGTGTYVFYFTDLKIFYLWGDDYMGHYDGMVGPFAGDPRQELLRVAVSSGTYPRHLVPAEACD